MRESGKTEEQQKDCIFNTFLKSQSDSSSSRRQVYYPMLCEQIYKWYRDYRSVDVDSMGLEIVQVINRFVKADTNPNIPSDKEGFFKYLVTALKTAKNSSYRNFNENEIVKIPREKKKKLKEIWDFIKMKESHLGRELTTQEKRQGIEKWFRNPEYLDLLNKKNVGSLTLAKEGDSDGMDPLGKELTPLYNSSAIENPLNGIISENNMEKIAEAVTVILNKKQKRSRDCYKALFTLYCLDNLKDYMKFSAILDQEILESWKKSNKIPKQYEIYQKFHPKATKPSAEAMASTNLREFVYEIRSYLKNNN